jgi:protein gp37
VSKTKIAWAEETWSPVTGCSKISPGCSSCYAERLSTRWGRTTKPWTPENAAENVVLHPERLSQPTHWALPRRIFVCPTADLFHDLVPGEYINQVWMEMFNNPRHEYLLLTKRPERLKSWTETAASAKGWPIEDIWPRWFWLGTSIENDRFAYRADILRATPAKTRWISAEPLLGPLPSLDFDGIDWCVIGGESGPKARPMDPEWVRDLVERADEASTAVFVKQDSGLRPGQQGNLPDDLFGRREYPR